MSDSDAIIVFFSAPHREEAVEIAEMLVKSRLAACVQILPEMLSVYRWQGKTERQPEVLVLAKTVRSRFSELEREVRSVHSYETPEIIAVAVTDVSVPYLDWLVNSTKATD